MSGIFGIWNRDGEAVNRDLLSAMAEAIAHRGGDTLDFSAQGSAGFGCHLRRVTPESRLEHQPVLDRYGNLLLFDGRIDNRKDLLAALDRDGEAGETPDSELVLAVLRHWGRKGLDRLMGDFALAFFSPADHTLVLARDPVGCRPLYYWTDHNRIVFASEIKAILTHPEVRGAPNLDLVADSILLNSFPYEDGGETFFANVNRVLPGWRLKVTPDRITSKCFWDFNPSVQLRHHAYSDYVLSLRELLVHAIKRRLRSIHPIALAVSGGLDSSIVLGIADHLCKLKSSESALAPISYAPTSDPNSEENEFLRLMEAQCGRSVERLSMGQPGDAECLAAAAWHSESPFLDDSWCAEGPLLARAQEIGARVLLTGLWSDQYMFETGYLVDLFKRLSWRRVYRHLAEYPKWFLDCEPAYFRGRFFRELLLNLTPRLVRAMLRPFYGETAIFNANRKWAGPGIVARARRLRPAVRHPRYRSAHARSIYQAVHSKANRMSIEADEKIAARFGLERLTPFLDRDVIAFLMAIPGEIQNRRGVPRGLLRDAVRGLIPRPVRQRRWADEGTVSSELARQRTAAYRSLRLDDFASTQFGFSVNGELSDQQYLEALGLEFWARAFFMKNSEFVFRTPHAYEEAI